MISDDGGLLTQSGVSVRVLRDGQEIDGSPFPSAPEGIDLTLPAGTYKVLANGAGGYASTAAGDCDLNGNTLVNGGFTSSCIVTVNDVAPTLTVITKVTNNDGLSAGPGASRSHVRPKNSSTDIAGSPQAGSASGATFKLRGDATVPYQVVEDNPGALHYIATYSGDCLAQPPPSASTRHARITNDDIHAQHHPRSRARGRSRPPSSGPWQMRSPRAPPTTIRHTSSAARSPARQCSVRGPAPERRDGPGRPTSGAVRLYNGDQCTRSTTYPATITLSDATHATVVQAQTPGRARSRRPLQRPDDRRQSPRSRTPSSSNPMWWASSCRTVIVTCSRSRSGSCPKSRRSVSRKMMIRSG